MMTHCVTATDVLFDCDGGPGRGLGHVRRMLFLAAALREGPGVASAFAIPDDTALRTRVEAEGFLATPLPGDEGHAPALLALAAATGVRVVVLDRATPVDVGVVDALRATGLRVVVIDQVGDGARAADLALLPVAHATGLEHLAAGRAAVLQGAPYVLVDPALVPAPLRPLPARPRVLVTMGSADPQRLALAAVEALAACRGAFRVTVVVGAHCAFREALVARTRALGDDAQALVDPPGLAPLLAAADLVVAAFGITAYDAARVGVPVLLLAHDARSADDARRFAALGSAAFGGWIGPPPPDELAAALLALAKDAPRRSAMHAAGTRLVDGRGAERGAQALAGLVRGGG